MSNESTCEILLFASISIYINEVQASKLTPKILPKGLISTRILEGILSMKHLRTCIPIIEKIYAFKS